MKIRQITGFLWTFSFGLALWALFGASPSGLAHQEAGEAPSVVNRILGTRRVSAIAQDKYGFLWFGTDNGLFRWDGAQTEEFYRRSGGARSLPDNAILHIHEDTRGALWIGTANGLARFQRESGDFTSVLSGKSVADIHEERSGALWCWAHTADASADEIYRFDPANGESLAFSEGKSGLKSAYLYAFLEDASGVVWLGTANGLHRFDRATKTFTAQMTDAATPRSPARAAESHILSLLEDAKTGTLFVGTGRGVRRLQTLPSGGFSQSASALNGLPPLLAASAIPLLFQSASGEPIAFAMQPAGANGANKGAFARLSGLGGEKTSFSQTSFAPVAPMEGKTQSHRLSFDGKGNAYWCVGNGAVKFHAASGATSLLFADSANPARIHSPVTAAVAASSGAVWFGKIGVGCVVIPPPREPFRSVVFAPSRSFSTSLLSPRVSALAEAPDGTLWIGYDGGAGASRLNTKTMTLRHYLQNPNNPASISGYAGETTVRAFLADKSGAAMWAAASSLDKITESRGETVFSHFNLTPRAVVSPTALAQSANGALWVGSAFGLFLLRAEDGLILRQFTRGGATGAAGLGGANIHALAKDAKGNVWAAHDAGVDKIEETTLRCTQYNVSNGLPAGAATALMVDSKGNVWVGSRGGAAMINPKTNKVERTLRASDGLPDEPVAAICEDARGRLWISCHRGLCRYEPETGVITRFSLADGLTDEEFMSGAAMRARDGKLWFGARSALVHFHPDSLFAVSSRAKALVTGLKKFGARVATPEYIADMRSIELGYDDKIVAFEYAAPAAFYAEALQFAYKLEGLDTAWATGGKEREAKYTNLPAGEYRFCVRVANKNGVWQDEPTSLTVVVHPPWWLSWQFILCAILTTAGSVFWGYKRRIRAILEQKQTLERLVAERTRQLEKASAETRRQLEITNEQAREIERTNKSLHIANEQLDATLQELKQTQTQLVQSERLNVAGMLTAGVMHEINNPNASIHSALELLERHLRKAQEYFLSLVDEQARASREAQGLVEMFAQAGDFTRIALKGSNRILTIVQTLQGFTKHQSEGATQSAVAEEVHASVEMFHYQFKNVQTVESIPRRLMLEAQWSEMNQAILNLLVNAAQAGATKIEISAQFDDERKNLALTIADNGEGMDEITLQRIFEPFFTTKKFGNSGLGLSIARQIIERRGGEIRVQSKPSEGTTFTVILPEQSPIFSANAAKPMRAPSS